MATEIEVITREINELRQGEHLKRVETALALGKRLVRAQGLLPEGEWTRWRQEKVHFSARTAVNLMGLFRFQQEHPDSLGQLGRLGLNKLYRLAALPDRLLRKLKPDTPLRIPGTSLRKTMEAMNPVELNSCLGRWTRRAGCRRPNQMARAIARSAEKLRDTINRFQPRMDRVRPELRAFVQQHLCEVVKACEACLEGVTAAQPAA